MDKEYYDEVGAGVALQEFIAVRSAGKHKGLQLVNFNKVSETDMLAVEFDGPKRIKLVVGSSSHGVAEEAVLRIQGILGKSSLPPVIANLWNGIDAARFIRQSVTIVGLGAASFKQIVASMADVAEFMGRQVVNGEVNSWKPVQVGGHTGITIGNRYFTWKHSNSVIEAIKFQRMVDPKGTLADMACVNYVHTIDNEVDYSECNVVDGGRNEYKSKDPSTFKIGDIVEAKMTFDINPSRAGGHEMNLTLRGLTLLDDSFSKLAHGERIKANKVENRQASMVIKRSKGFDETDDDVRQISKKLKCMETHENKE